MSGWIWNLSSEDKLLNANQLGLYFSTTPNVHLYSDLLKIAHHFFCIHIHNAYVKWIFSLMTQRRTKERKALNPETVSQEILLCFRYNLGNAHSSSYKWISYLAYHWSPWNFWGVVEKQSCVRYSDVVSFRTQCLCMDAL